ncbi:CLUMA_CG003004, isoform A [Clunio marinus]|uniref:CLUMA_CG003004, isoform A n=1 Tax=Clunio marinus TaxID=568069 RepID=A0A1J1HMG9_9DIPT|nr:CLUMA_CG003004, isoform A [Clunio marinus]
MTTKETRGSCNMKTILLDAYLLSSNRLQKIIDKVGILNCCARFWVVQETFTSLGTKKLPQKTLKGTSTSGNSFNPLKDVIKNFYEFNFFAFYSQSPIKHVEIYA